MWPKQANMSHAQGHGITFQPLFFFKSCFIEETLHRPLKA